jgi:hypothetical protein
MAVHKSISEVVAETGKLKSTSEKVAHLQKNDSFALRTVVQATYDPSIEFLIPNTPPPWNKNEYEDEAKAMLISDSRRLRIFVKGGGYDNIKPVKRESLFISFLEDIDNDDAELLANYMICKKPFKGISLKVIKEAFPQLIKETA